MTAEWPLAKEKKRCEQRVTVGDFGSGIVQQVAFGTCLRGVRSPVQSILKIVMLMMTVDIRTEKNRFF